MHSFTAIAIILAGFAGLAAPQAIDPNSVPLATRQKWCKDQQSACPLLCLQQPNTTSTPSSNKCEAETLIYSCICSNGQQPNASEYSLTIPYYTCTESNTQCVNNCAGNSACQSDCRTKNPCGAQEPTRVNTSTSSPTMSATATGDSTAGSGDTVTTGFGGAAATQTAGSGGGTSGASGLAINVGHAYGLGVVAAGFFAGFAFLL
ncbi:hypothetical protein MMC16_000337 [Acarospora aff. strigata]|nr:hypothetical protein [Acarospora aff. strigata]